MMWITWITVLSSRLLEYCNCTGLYCLNPTVLLSVYIRACFLLCLILSSAILSNSKHAHILWQMPTAVWVSACLFWNSNLDLLCYCAMSLLLNINLLPPSDCLDSDPVDGVGLVAGRTQREKKRSYKDLLREEEELAAQVRKNSKKRLQVRASKIKTYEELATVQINNTLVSFLSCHKWGGGNRCTL